MKVKEIMEKDIDPNLSRSYYYRSGGKEFRAKYAQKDSEDVDWIEICQDAIRCNYCKYALTIVVKLLELGLYQGSYREQLEHNLPLYQDSLKNNKSTSSDLMCGEKIVKQILLRYEDFYKVGMFSYLYVDTNNAHLKKIIENHLNSIKVTSFQHLRDVVELCGKSLGKYESKIQSVSDFNSNTLFEQINFFKVYFSNNRKLRGDAIKYIIDFYRWLVRINPEHDYFENSFNMSEILLFSSSFKTLVEKNYYFTILNPKNIPYGKDRICFILKGLDQSSTRIKNEDYVPIDFSGLTNVFYRDLLIEFIISSTASTIQWVGIPAFIIEAMEKIYQTKQNPSYPNKSLDYLSNQEAVFIRQIFSAQDIGIRAKNNKIGAVRRFLNFCVDKKAITVDNLFFDYLRQYEEPNKNTAKTISDENLSKINEYLLEKSKNSLFYKEMYVIFHLALQTEFRINQICHLNIDCIHPTIKPNQFEITSNSKTSHGRKNSYVISSITYNLLMDIIEETESIRENCPVDSMKQYIFVYEQPHRSNKPIVFDSSIFSNYLSKACEFLNIERYSAVNLRDTHMTKSLEHIIRNGKSDMEMSVLSKHKYIDTTKNHYIEMELENMLEATYGITIGTELVETDSKVVDKIPEKLQGKENDVENGCGKCTAESCTMIGSLPCLACKHFITTVKHEVYFKKAIENTDRLINMTTNAHDKEDLITIKTLYVLYLKAINLHKEGVMND